MTADPRTGERLGVALIELAQGHGAPGAEHTEQVTLRYSNWVGKDLPWARPGTDKEFFCRLDPPWNLGAQWFMGAPAASRRPLAGR